MIMMKNLIVIFSLSTLLLACDDSKNASESKDSGKTQKDSSGIQSNLDEVFENDQQKQSYAFGLLQSRDLKQMYSNPQIGDKVDRTEILAGIEDILMENDVAYDEEKANTIAKNYLSNQNPTDNEKKEASYCIGLVEGRYIKDFYKRENVGVSLNYEYLFWGIKDALDKNSEPKMEFSDANRIITPIMKKYTYEQNKTFLSNNAKSDSVQVTESGLQYKVLKKGTGKRPNANSSVEVHYTGRLINGKVFDTSVKEVAQESGVYNPKREPYDPAVFPLNRVIPGWTEGIQLMREGAEYMFYIPSELGYGEQGTQGIPGGATLIFEVKLIEVKG